MLYHVKFLSRKKNNIFEIIIFIQLKYEPSAFIIFSQLTYFIFIKLYNFSVKKFFDYPIFYFLKITVNDETSYNQLMK